MHSSTHYFVLAFLLPIALIAHGEGVDDRRGSIQQAIAKLPTPAEQSLAQEYLLKLNNAESEDRFEAVRGLISLNQVEITESLCLDKATAFAAFEILKERGPSIEDSLLLSRLSITWQKESDKYVMGGTPGIEAEALTNRFNRLLATALKQPGRPKRPNVKDDIAWQIKIANQAKETFADDRRALDHIEKLLAAVASEDRLERERQARQEFALEQFSRLRSDSRDERRDAMRALLDLRDPERTVGLSLASSKVLLVLEVLESRKLPVAEATFLSNMSLEWMRRTTDPLFTGKQFADSAIYSREFGKLFARVLRQPEELPEELNARLLLAWQLDVVKSAKETFADDAEASAIIDKLFEELANKARPPRPKEAVPATVAKADEPPPSVDFTASWTSYDLIVRAYRSYREHYQKRRPNEQPFAEFDFDSADSDAIDRKVWSGDVLVGSLSETIAEDDRRGRPWPVRPQQQRYAKYPLGQYVIAVVVSATNPLPKLTLRQVGDIFRGKVQKWNELPGSNGTGAIELYGQFCASTAGTIVQRKAMERRGFAPILQNLKNPPLRQKFSPVEVIGDLIGDANGIGFLMLGPDEELDRRVRIVPLAADDESPASLPTLENLAKGNYPLTDQQTIYLRDDAPRALREFCTFAVGAETAPVLSKQRLWAEHRIQQKLSEFRIAAVKRGEGAPVTVAGPASAENLVKDLALQYVVAREAVQVGFRKVRAAEEAARVLEEGSAELMVVEVQVGEAGNADADGDGILLGRAALGVIVHPSLGLSSLRMDELRAICAGEIGHWPAASGEGPRIRGYALHTSRSVMGVYQGLTESKGRGLPLASRTDSAQVVLSVARDPAGIGFVDLSELPPLDGSVVLVGSSSPA